MRIADALTAALVLLALLYGAARLGSPSGELGGPFRVVDGDTLESGRRRVRLMGMDAPELDQICRRDGEPYRCGEVARDALAALTREVEIRCASSGHDRYGRDLATCRAGELDLGRELVRRGLAVAYGGYRAEESAASAEHLGLWAGSFEMPADWRREHARRGSATRAEAEPARQDGRAGLPGRAQSDTRAAQQR